MKLTTTLTSVAILAALVAFLAAPAVHAEDEAAPPPPAAGAEPDRTPPPADARPPHAPRPRGPHPLQAADADRDGSITAAEWKAFLDGLQKRFADLDKDEDGALSRDELPRPPRRAADDRRGPRMRGPDGHRPGMRGPRDDRRGPDRRGPDMQRRGPHGPGPGMRGPHPDRGPGPGMRGPRPDRGRGAPDGTGDLGPRLERLTSALEKLLERMESRPPR